MYPGNNPPYYLKSDGKEQGTFIRLDATTRLADESMLGELELRGKKRFYDELPFLSLAVENSEVAMLCSGISERAKHLVTQDDLLNMGVLLKVNNSIQATRAY